MNIDTGSAWVICTAIVSGYNPDHVFLQMIPPDAQPIANVSPYKRIELGAKPKQPEPKWVPVDPNSVAYASYDDCPAAWFAKQDQSVES